MFRSCEYIYFYLLMNEIKYKKIRETSFLEKNK